MIQKPFPCLTTERLLLRQLEHTDDKAIFALRSNEQVNEFIQRPLTTNLDGALDFITAINEGIEKNDWLYWALILKSNQQLIGTICLWHFSNENTVAEIGYEMQPDYQGAGLMHEALQTVINYGLTTLQLEVIEAYTQPENKNSVKLLEKNGFIRSFDPNYNNIANTIKYLLVKQPK